MRKSCGIIFLISLVQIWCNSPNSLTIKRNICEIPLPEVASRFIVFKKIVYQIKLQIYRGNTQQGAFTPIKFAKPIYKPAYLLFHTKI